MRTTVFGLLQCLIDTNELREPIMEFGSARVANQAHLPSVRSFFPGKTYLGIDLNPGLGVDQRHDLHSLGLGDSSIGTALLLDTIEHVAEPQLAMDELRRCLASDGVLILTTHFFFPIHRFPSDYWRFTSEGILSLLREFDRSRAGEAGLRLFPHTVVGLAGGPGVETERWDRLCDAVDKWLNTGAQSWKERAMNVLPPVLVQRGYELYAMRPSRRSQN